MVVEVAAAVVKVQLLAATVLPARSLAPVTRAVYDVPALRLAVGFSVAVVPGGVQRDGACQVVSCRSPPRG